METEGCLSAESTLRVSKSLKRCFAAAIIVLLTCMFFGALCQAQILGTSQLNTARRGHTATLLDDGKVLIVGGDNQSGMVSQAEIFDPTSQTLSQPLRSSRERTIRPRNYQMGESSSSVDRARMAH